MITVNCPCCKAQTPIIWWGFRLTKERGKIRRYKCTLCRRTFVERDGYFRKHKPKDKILAVLSQWWKGLTSRELADEHDICQSTVLRWLLEYTIVLYRYLCRKIQRYAKKLHADELFLKMRKQFYYVWDALCADSRFAFVFLSKFRDSKSAAELLQLCPMADEITTDGAFSYCRPVKQRYGYSCRHHQCIDFEDKKHNNIMERLQNTMRRFLHPRRGFHSLETGRMQLAGWLLFYNFIRIHTAIGMTPAEKAGVIGRYKGLKTVKQRIEWLIEQAVSLWLIIANRKCWQCPYFSYAKGIYRC